jgi:putative ABC transport system substrate-binding protein
MKRREFIKLVGGVATAWPLAAQAQQPTMPVIGFLRSTTLKPFENLVTAFRQGLKEEGFVEGQNVAVEYRYAENQLDRLPGLVADLIRRPVAVIAGDTLAAIPMKATTSTVPIVFMTGGDPVRSGLVDSLNRPGGNVTGVVFFGAALGAKRLELLHQLVPSAATIAMLVDPNSPSTEAERTDVQAAAEAIRRQLVILDVSIDRDIDTVVAALVERQVGGLLVGAGTFLGSNRERIAALAAHHRLPAIYSQREATLAGGLMSYGPSTSDAYRQAGLYVGRILKGEKTGDLPVMRSTKFELVINLKTAKMLSLELPATLLARADEVFE